MSNKLYDILRLVEEILPIFGTLATTLLALYGVPDGTVAIVGGTVTAIEAALVSLIRIAKANYDKEIESEEIKG